MWSFILSVGELRKIQLSVGELRQTLPIPLSLGLTEHLILMI